MYYVQFLQRSTGYITGTIPPQFGKPEVIEATGDRAVVILDGRESRNTMHNFADTECTRRGYCGYQLFKGPSFSRSTPISERIINQG